MIFLLTILIKCAKYCKFYKYIVYYFITKKLEFLTFL